MPKHQEEPEALAHTQVKSDLGEANRTIQLLRQEARPTLSSTYTREISLGKGPGCLGSQKLAPTPSSSEIL